MPGTKRRAPYKYSEQQTVRSSHRPLTPWLALAGKPVNRCPRTTCAYSDCRAFAGIPSRLFLLSESQHPAGVRLKMGEMWMRLFFGLDLTAYNAVRLKTCPLLPRSQPASANSPPNWLNLNLCAAARFPSAPSSAARRAALAPAIPRLATVLTKA